MSYPNWAPNAPARRPTVVAVAALLLGLLAFGALAYAIAGLAILPEVGDRYRAAAAGAGATRAQVDDMVLLLRGYAALAAVVNVVVAALLVVVVLGLLRGSSGSRVGAWVVCGAGLLCGVAALGAQIVQRAVPWRAAGSATSALVGRLAEAYPPWWIPLTAGLSVGQALGYLVVAVLLAMPAANAFFRRRPTGPRPAAAPLTPSR